MQIRCEWMERCSAYAHRSANVTTRPSRAGATASTYKYRTASEAGNPTRGAPQGRCHNAVGHA